MNDEGEPIAYIEFAGGTMRPVFEDDRSQFVFDDDRNRVNGVWFIPVESDSPTIVTPMNDRDRFKLIGTYKTPRVRIGTVLTCEARDCDVVVTGYSDGRIPWPRGRKRQAGGGAGFVVFGGLSDAIRIESNLAVSHWFGVDRKVVTKWRRALQVARTNDGTLRLRQGYSREEWFQEFRLAGVAKARDPERLRKLSELRKGKILTRQHKAAIRRGMMPVSAETRAKLSAARKESAKRVATNGQVFTTKQDEIIRKHPACKAAKLTGRSLFSIYGRRRLLGLATGRE